MKVKRLLSALLVICMIAGMLPANAFAVETEVVPTTSDASYPALELDVEATANIEEEGQSAYFTITPQIDICAEFISLAAEGPELMAYLLDAEMNELASSCVMEDGYNFSLGQQLQAGVTYILQVRYTDNAVTGSFPVKLTHAGYSLGWEVEQEPTCTQEGVKHYFCPNCAYERREVIPVTHQLEAGVCTACGHDARVALEMDGRAVAELPNKGMPAWFSFTPAVTCSYRFEGHAPEGDTSCDLFDENGNWLTNAYYGGENGNFGLSYYLEGGKNYSLSVQYRWYESTGSFDVSVSHSLDTSLKSECVQEHGCEQDGIINYTCNNCGHAFTVVTPASHTFEYADHVEPTCTEAGWDLYCCMYCDAEHTEYLAAYGHTFSDGKCSACGAFDEQGGNLTDTITWRVSGADHVLHIQGEGAMPDMYDYWDQPWRYSGMDVYHVVIGEGITGVGNNSFACMYELQTAVLPSTLTRIGNMAFNYCNKLAEVNIPAGLTELGERSFFDTAIREITIPGGVKDIPYGVFVFCDELTSVVLEDGVESLDSSVFASCEKLETVTLSATLRSIGYDVFEETAIKTIDLPAAVETITLETFRNCHSLTAINVDPQNSIFHSNDGLLYEGTSLHAVPWGLTTATVEAGTTYLSAYLGSGLQSLVFEGEAPEGMNYQSYTGEVPPVFYYPAESTTWHQNWAREKGVEIDCLPLTGVVILAGPSDFAVSEGDTVVMSVVAVGATEYTWQYFDETQNEWVNVGYGNDWTFVATAEDHHRVFMCTATNGTDVAYSENFMLSVRPVWNVESLGQTHEMTIEPDSYGQVRFTAETSGLYILTLDGYRDNIEMWADLPEEQIWINGNPMFAILAEAGKEYVIHIRNTHGEWYDYSTTVTMRMSTEIVITEGQILDLQMPYNEEWILKFTPEESGWYEIVGLPDYSLECQDHSQPREDESYQFNWLEAGQNYYIRFTNSDSDDKVYPAAVYKVPQLKVGDTLTGAFGDYSADRHVWFTPEESGMYRFAADNPDVYVYIDGRYCTNQYMEMEAGREYFVRIFSQTSNYITYNVTLEKLPMVVDGHMSTIASLDYGEEYMVGFCPDVYDKYIVTAFADDGTQLMVLVDNQGGSNDDWVVDAGQFVTIRVNNQSGETKNNITFWVRSQPKLKLGQETAVYVTRLENAHASFTPAEDGLYCVTSPIGMYIGEPVQVDTVAYDEGADGKCRSYYYLKAGQTYWMTFHSGELEEMTVRVDKVEASAVYGNIDINVAADESFVALLDVTEDYGYYWESLRYDYDGINEMLYRITEDGTQYINITYTYDDEGNCYATADMQAGQYVLVIWSEFESIFDSICVMHSPDPESIYLGERIILGENSDGSFQVAMEPRSYSTLKNVVWTVGDPSIVEIINVARDTVDLVSKNAGITTITATLPNGFQASITVVVKAPIDVAENEIFTTNIAAGDYETFQFTATESGYYVLRVDNIECYISGAFEESLDVDGQRYLYFWCEAGVTHAVNVGSDYEDVTVSVELRKAEAPTNVRMPNEKTLFLGNDEELQVTFGSPWEYARVNWSINGDAVDAYIENRTYIYLRTQYEGTAIVTAFIGDIELYCQVTVVESLPLTLDAPLSCEVASDGRLRVSFTAETSGFYVFEYDQEVWIELFDEWGNWYDYNSSDGTAVVWLDAGQLADLRIHNQSGMDRIMTVSVRRPTALSLNETLDTMIGYSDYMCYSFTAETDGHYTLRTVGGHIMNIDIYDSNGMALGLMNYGENGENFRTFEMKAGQTYTIKVYHYYADDQHLSLTVMPTPAPTEINLGQSAANMAVGEEAWVYVHFVPGYAYADCTVTAGDNGVLEFDRREENAYVFRALQEGEATVTATCGEFTETVNFVVKAPVNVSVGDTVELTIEPHEYEVIRFTPEESGYYVIRRDSWGGWIECNAYAVDEADGQTYYYVYCSGGYPYSFTYGAHEEPVAVTLELRKAQTPTQLNLPDTMTAYQGTYSDLYLTFGSPWQFGLVEWTIDSEVISLTNWHVFFAEIYGETEGTGIVTATCGELSASCYVTVIGNIGLTKDQPVTVDIAADGDGRFSFTPAESGYYVFNYGQDLGASLCDEWENWSESAMRGDGFCAYWLDADIEYILVLSDMIGTDRAITVTVSDPPEMYLNQAETIVMAENTGVIYQFTVPESGYYCLRIPYDLGINHSIYDWNRDHIAYQTSGGEGEYYYFTYRLDAGQRYAIIADQHYWYPLALEWCLIPAPVPTDMQLGQNTSNLDLGDMASVFVIFEPGYATADYSFALDDSGVLEYERTNGSEILFRTLKAGTATVTVYCGDMVRTVTFEVREPVAMSVGDVVHVEIPAYDYTTVTFCPEETGYYALRMGSNDVWWDGGNFEANTSVDGNQYTYGYFVANETYRVYFHSYDDPVSMDVELRKAEAPTQLYLPANMQIFLDEYRMIDVEFGSLWEYAPVRWNLENEILSEVYCDNLRIRVYAQSEGVCNLTATCGDLSTTCAVAVMESIPMTMDVPQTLELNANSISRLSFVAPAAGFYTFTYSDRIWVDVQFENGASREIIHSDDHLSIWLNAGEKTMFVLHDESGTDRAITVTMSRPSALSLNETVFAEVANGCRELFRYVPAEDGYYSLSMASWNLDIGIYDEYGSYIEANHGNDENYRYWTLKMEAGKEYAICVSNYTDGIQAAELTMQPAQTPVELELGTRGSYVAVGEYAHLHVCFAPVYAMADFSIILDDSGVLEYAHSNGTHYDFLAVKPGTTTVTVVCGELVETVTYIVQEPVDISVNTETELYLDAYESKTLRFHPTESGFYVVRVSNANVYGESGNYETSCVIDGERYFYAYWGEGETPTLTLRAEESEGVDFAVELRKAEEPTALTLSDDMVAYMNSCTTVQLRFGSPWEFARPQWTLSDNNVMNTEWESSLAAEFYCYAEGSAVVTVTYGELSDSCTVTVSRGLELTQGVPLEVEVKAGSNARFTFTPAESGFYTFTYGNGFDQDLRDAYDNWRSCSNEFDGMTCWLDGGMQYVLLLRDETGADRTVTVTVDEPKELVFDEAVSVQMHGNCNVNYMFVAPADGYYTLRSSSPDQYDVWFNDWNNHYVEYFSSSDGYNTYYTVYLTAGQRVMIRMRNSYSYDQWAELCVTAAPAPTGMYLGYSSLTVMPGESVSVQVHFEPAHAAADVQVSVDNPDVLQLLEINGAQYLFEALQLGETNVTFTCGNFAQTITIKVKEPVVMNGAGTVELSIPAQNSEALRFNVDEDGYYVIRITSPECWYTCNFGSDLQVVDGESYIYGYFYADWDSTLEIKAQHEPLNVTVELRKAEAPTEINLPERATVFVGSHFAIPVTFGSVWEYGAVEWQLHGDVLELNYWNNLLARCFANSVGTAVVTATCGELTKTCTVNVIDTVALNLGEPVSMDILGQSRTRVSFTAPEDGFYTFHYSDGFHGDLRDENDNWIYAYRSENSMTRWMAAGEKYILTLYNDSDEARTLEITAGTPNEMPFDETQSVVVPEGGAITYAFTPDQTGYYSVITVGDVDRSVRFYTWDNTQCRYRLFNDGPVRYTSAKLEAGQTYLIVVECHAGEPSYLEIGLHHAAVPENIGIYAGRRVMLPGGYGNLEIEFEPMYAVADVIIDIDRPDVMELSYNDGTFFEFIGRNPGVANVTITCGDIVRVIQYTVVEPQTAAIGEEVNVNITAFGGAGLSYQIPESGYYVIRVSNAEVNWNVVGYPVEDNSVIDGERYLYCYMDEGLHSLLLSAEFSAEVTVEMRKAEAPTEINLPDTATIYLGASRLMMAEFGSPWEYGIVHWTTDNREVIDWGNRSHNLIEVFGWKVGTATLTASCGELQDSCVITVRVPEIDAELVLGQYQDHMMADERDYGYYSFTAPESGDYFFAVISSRDARMDIYTSDWELREGNDDYFELHSGAWMHLSKGETVYVCSRMFGDNMGFLKTIVSTTEDVYDVFTGITLQLDEPLNLTLHGEIELAFTPEVSGAYTFSVQSEDQHFLWFAHLETGYEFNAQVPVSVELEAGVTYIIGFGNIYDRPSNVTLTVSAAAAEPVITSIVNTAEGVELTWDAVPGAAKYRVYIKTDSGWTKLADTTETSLIHTAAISGETYTYTVRGLNAAGNAFVGGYNKTGWSNTYVAQPEITAFENTASGIKITWGKVNGAAKYRVFVKTSKGWATLADTTGNSYVYEDAQPGQTYTFTIRCVNAEDEYVSSCNTAGWQQTYVAQPEITAFENTASGIKITWGAVEGAGKYRVYIKNGSSWTKVGDTTATSLVYDKAESGKTYCFTVRAMNAEATAFVSSCNTTGWQQTYVAQPEITAFENTASGIKITWGKVAGAEKYRVFVKTSKGWATLADTTATSYVYEDAQPGQTYTFTVRCLSADGKTYVSYCNTAGWQQTYVAQPAITGFENTDSGIKITWGAVEGAGKYRVYIKNGSSWTKLADTTGNSYTYTGAEPGQTYTFTVRAMNAAATAFVSSCNTTGWSHTYAPAMPEITKLESTTGGIKLTWDAISGAAKYRVFVKTSKGWATLGDTADTSYVYAAANLGTAYTFTVRCLSADGKTYTSGYNTAGWSCTFAPVPEITKLENGDGGIKLTWSAINGAAKYRVFVKTSKGWTKLADVAGSSYTYTGATSGLTYTFTVRCLNEAGTTFTSGYNTTGWSHTYTPVVSVPEVTAMENTTSGIKLTWSAIAGAAKYRVFVKTSKGWTKLADVTGNSYTYTGAKLGTAYTFTVRGLNEAGTAFTSGYNTTGWSHTFAPVPEVTNMESTTGGIKLTWSAINGAAKYRVFVKTSKGWLKLADVTGNTYTYTGAKLGTAYTFTVRCLNEAGTAFTSGYNTTGWSHTFTPVPAFTELESTASGIELTWSAINGAAKYRVFVKTSKGWTKLADVTGNSYTYTAAKAGLTYTFTVRCLNEAGTAFTSGYNTTGWKVTHTNG